MNKSIIQFNDHSSSEQYGIALSLSKSSQTSAGPNGKVIETKKIGFGDGHVSYYFDDRERVILPTIGMGRIAPGTASFRSASGGIQETNNLGGATLATTSGSLNRDIRSMIGATSRDQASLDTDVPVGKIIDSAIDLGRMIKDYLAQPQESLGVSAGSEDPGYEPAGYRERLEKWYKDEAGGKPLISAGTEDPDYEPEPYEPEPRISADAITVMVDGHVLTPESSRVDRAAGNRTNNVIRENNVATDSVDGYNGNLGADELETQKSFSFLRYANDAMGVSSSEAYSGALAAGDVSSLLSVTGSIAANVSVTSLGINVLRSAAVASSELAPAGLLLAGAYGSYAYLHDNANDLVALSKIGSEVTANDVDLSHYDLEARGKLISAGFDPDDITQDYVNSVAKGLWARDNQLNENENPSVLEKRRNDYSKSRPDSGFKDSAGTGMPGPDDFEPDDEKPESRKCAKAESEVWKKLNKHKIINGKETKTNSLSGNARRYYQWDDWHKEIEVYDRHGKPIEVIDPVKGEIIPKSLRTHQRINI